MADYQESDVPDQLGRTILMTGANTGIGYEAARVLAARGARVLLGCRSPEKGTAALERIKARSPDANLGLILLDLGSLASIRAAAEQVLQEPQLDVLINNAGVMAPPRQLTEDGFELQFGINHLGHFALTGHLLPLLKDRDNARIVTVSSSGHKVGRIIYEDINAEQSYRAGARYSMSKIANLLFTRELQRRLAATGSKAIAVACHPGGTATDLSRHLSPLFNATVLPLLRVVINKPPEGALPTLMAATQPGVQGNAYFGPAGFMELVRSAKKVQPNAASQDAQDAARLWQLSIDMTGVDPNI